MTIVAAAKEFQLPYGILDVNNNVHLNQLKRNQEKKF